MKEITAKLGTKGAGCHIVAIYMRNEWKRRKLIAKIAYVIDKTRAGTLITYLAVVN